LVVLIVILVTVASVDDGTIAPEVLRQLTVEHQPHLKIVLGDSKYRIRLTFREQPPGFNSRIACGTCGLIRTAYCSFARGRIRARGSISLLRRTLRSDDTDARNAPRHRG
jgi:hypothetical protein